MVGVGSTIGTGIFFILSESVPVAGPAAIWSFVIAGAVAGLAVATAGDGDSYDRDLFPTWDTISGNCNTRYVGWKHLSHFIYEAEQAKGARRIQDLV